MPRTWRPGTRPALLHFDLWDGNVPAADGPDPLLDLVSSAPFRRIEVEPGRGKIFRLRWCVCRHSSSPTSAPPWPGSI
jgi:hypothetical protein